MLINNCDFQYTVLQYKKKKNIKTDIEMSLKEKIKQIKKELYLKKMGKEKLATVLLAASSLSVPSMASENQPQENITQHQTNLQSQDEPIEFYTKTIALADDDIANYLVMGQNSHTNKKAFFHPSINQGKGGFIIYQYSITDKQAFNYARTNNPHNTDNQISYDDALKQLNLALNNYNLEHNEIKNLTDVKTLFSSLNEGSRKDKKLLSQMLNNPSILTLQQASQTQEALKQRNQELLSPSTIFHEFGHQQRHDIIASVLNGENIVQPQNMFKLQMIDELIAWVDEKSPKEGLSSALEQFSAVSADYTNEYNSKGLHQTIHNQAYKTLFAQALTSTYDTNKPVYDEINDSYIEYTQQDERIMRNFCGNQKYFVFSPLRKTDQQTQFTASDGKQYLYNILYSVQTNQPILNEAKQYIHTQYIASADNYGFIKRAALTKDEQQTYSTQTMDENFQKLENQLLSKYDENTQQILKNYINNLQIPDDLKNYQLSSEEIKQYREEQDISSEYFQNLLKKHYEMRPGIIDNTLQKYTYSPQHGIQKSNTLDWAQIIHQNIKGISNR